MSKKAGVRIAALVLGVLALLAGPVAGASASRASIKAALRSYSARIAVAEGHTLSAVGEFKTTKDPTPVEEAITRSIDVLQALRARIAVQSARAHRVEVAKSKLEKGLAAIISSYEKLKSAYAEERTDPSAAQSEAASALEAVKRGRAQLEEAEKLLA